MNAFTAFLRRNRVLVVMVPVVVGAHLGWYALQFSDMYVPKENKQIKVMGLDLTRAEAATKK